MKGPDTEALPRLLLGALAEFEDLELADLVAEALSRPGDISVDFSLNRRLISGATFTKVGHSLVGPGAAIC